MRRKAWFFMFHVSCLHSSFYGVRDVDVGGIGRGVVAAHEPRGGGDHGDDVALGAAVEPGQGGTARRGARADPWGSGAARAAHRGGAGQRGGDDAADGGGGAAGGEVEKRLIHEWARTC